MSAQVTERVGALKKALNVFFGLIFNFVRKVCMTGFQYRRLFILVDQNFVDPAPLLNC
jgi:hypothetical protein